VQLSLAGDKVWPLEGVILAKYKFIDLFAGIGGFHLAFHKAGAECVFASEWDDDARLTYEANFRRISPKLFKNENFVGDITKVKKSTIPNFDILTGGFPCQPFSQAGHGKGFKDTRGTLFFDIAEIIKVKKPQAFFLENVQRLHSHDNGRTFKVIERILTKELGYSFYHKIVRASDHGLPQHRPRIFMVGFRDTNIEFEFPNKRELLFNMSDVMGGKVDREIGLTLRVGGKSSPINDRRNWDGYLVNGKPRRLTPKEALRMQGFPASFKFPVNDSAAMRQLGNSVAVKAVHDYAKQILKSLENS
jgi:DNA (cytosine-5)-methyltransferase 1